MPATHPLDPTSCAATHQPRPHHLCKLIAPCCCPPTRRSGTGQRARHLRHLPDRLSQDAHGALQAHRNVRQLRQEVPKRVHPRLRALLPRNQGPGPHSRMSQPAHRRQGLSHSSLGRELGGRMQQHVAVGKAGGCSNAARQPQAMVVVVVLVSCAAVIGVCQHGSVWC